MPNFFAPGTTGKERCQGTISLIRLIAQPVCDAMGNLGTAHLSIPPFIRPHSPHIHSS